MRGVIPPFPQYVFIASCLVKHRDNFTFYRERYEAVEQNTVDIAVLQKVSDAGEETCRH
jgi:hypothetical protein